MASATGVAPPAAGAVRQANIITPGKSVAKLCSWCMHICWLAGHFVEPNTPGWCTVRGAKDSRSGSSLPPENARNTSPISAWLRSPSPRTRSAPWFNTAWRNASRWAAVQSAARPPACAASSGGLPGWVCTGRGGADVIG